MKILQVGPNSVHVSSYISALSEKEKDIYLLSEEVCDFQGVKENFVISLLLLEMIIIMVFVVVEEQIEKKYLNYLF
jgi:hypothetical protein